MMSFCFILPIFVIFLSMILTVKAVRKGANRKKAVISQIASVFGCMVFMFLASAFVFCPKAEETESASVNDFSEYNQESAASKASAFGIGLIAAALAAGLSGIGGGLSVASAAPAAIAATSEDPKAFGKSLIFVALGEGIALYGLLVSIMIFNQLEKLGV